MFFDRGHDGDPKSRLYIPNVDNGLELSDTVSGETGTKARQVMPRFLHYCQEGDGLVMSKKVPEFYLGYIKKLYGFATLPTIYIAPNRNIANPEVPFSILHDILCNERLMKELTEVGYEKQWEVTPFISHKWAHKLGRRTHLPVHGVSFDRVASGHTTYFNDKVRFMRDCHVLHIPTPPGVIARGWGDLCKKTEEKIAEHGEIILRVGKSGGGYGLCIIKSEVLTKFNISASDYLELQIPHTSRRCWNEEEVLVEQYLPKVCSPSTLVYITDTDIKRVIDTNQILDDKDHFLGAVIPSGLDETILEECWLDTIKIASYVQESGGRGFYGIDWGIIEDSSISRVAFEPNYRFTGNWHIVCIRHKLKVNEHAVTMHKDKMFISPKITFEILMDALNAQGLLWDVHRGDGVVITIPPDGEIFGFVCIGNDRTRAQELFDAVEAFAHRSFLHESKT